MPNCFFIGHRVAPSDLCPLLDEAVERHIVQFGVPYCFPIIRLIGQWLCRMNLTIPVIL